MSVVTILACHAWVRQHLGFDFAVAVVRTAENTEVPADRR